MNERRPFGPILSQLSDDELRIEIKVRRAEYERTYMQSLTAKQALENAERESFHRWQQMMIRLLNGTEVSR